jgi:hypothetical protein
MDICWLQELDPATDSGPGEYVNVTEMLTDPALEIHLKYAPERVFDTEDLGGKSGVLDETYTAKWWDSDIQVFSIATGNIFVAHHLSEKLQVAI